jgi:hypothetical protein
MPGVVGPGVVRVLVIHGLWAHGAACLWAEDSALPATAPPPGARPSRAPRPHPFAARPPDLAGALAGLPELDAGLAGQAAAALAGQPAGTGLTLRLPSGADGPLASPELVRPPGQEGAGAGRDGRRRVSLAAWRVPALAFPPAAAVGLLAVLGEPGAFSGEAVAGAARVIWPRWPGWPPTWPPGDGCCRRCAPRAAGPRPGGARCCPAPTPSARVSWPPGCRPCAARSATTGTRRR